MRHLSTDLRRRRNTSEVSTEGGRDVSSNTGVNGMDGDVGSKIRKRLRHPHLPPLYYSAHNRDWEDVIRRSRTHPHEILVQEDISGNTPLHVACRHDPPVNVVKALMIVCKERNNDNATPLHIAASYRCSSQVIAALIEGDKPTNDQHRSSPTIIARTKMGRAPIHYACMSFRGLSVEAFKVLLEATIKSVQQYDHHEWWDHEDDDDDNDDEQLDNDNKALDALTLQDYTGQTPLALLFRRYKERVRCVIKMVESSSNTSRAISAVRADLNELWEKARLIVGMMAEQQQQRIDNIVLPSKQKQQQQTQESPIEIAAAMEAAKWAVQQHSYPKQSYDDHLSAMTVAGRKFRIVHASVGLTGYGCPPEMIKLAISVHPDQVREMDEDGFLPIHIAAVASSYHNIGSDNNHKCENDTDSNNRPTVTPFHHEEEGEESSLSSDYTELSNHKWEKFAFDKVIKLLLRKYPFSVRIPHGKTGRLPLILAIEAKNRTWKDGIETLFLSNPAALESKEINPKLYPTIFSFVGNNHNSDNDNDEYDTHLVTTKGCHLKKKYQRVSAMDALFQLIRAKPNILVRRK